MVQFSGFAFVSQYILVFYFLGEMGVIRNICNSCKVQFDVNIFLLPPGNTTDNIYLYLSAVFHVYFICIHLSPGDTINYFKLKA